MSNDNSKSNIIPLRDHGENSTGSFERACDGEGINDFIVDMLDTLMKIATKKDQSLLVYFLAMARIEAMELKKSEDEKKEKDEM